MCVAFFIACSIISLLVFGTFVRCCVGLGLSSYLVIGFAHEHLSVQSLYYPFSELCPPHPGHFPVMWK